MESNPNNTLSVINSSAQLAGSTAQITDAQQISHNRVDSLLNQHVVMDGVLLGSGYITGLDGEDTNIIGICHSLHEKLKAAEEK